MEELRGLVWLNVVFVPESVLVVSLAVLFA